MAYYSCIRCSGKSWTLGLARSDKRARSVSAHDAADRFGNRSCNTPHGVDRQKENVREVGDMIGQFTAGLYGNPESLYSISPVAGITEQHGGTTRTSRILTHSTMEMANGVKTDRVSPD